MADIKCYSCSDTVTRTTDHYDPTRMSNPTMFQPKDEYRGHDYLWWPKDGSFVGEAITCPVCEAPFVDGHGQAHLVPGTVAAEDLLAWATVMSHRTADSLIVCLELIAATLIERKVLTVQDAVEMMPRASKLDQERQGRELEALRRSQDPKRQRDNDTFKCWCGETLSSLQAYGSHMNKHKRKGETKENFVPPDEIIQNPADAYALLI